MFQNISLLIFREIFIGIHNTNDLLNFKFILRRICNFINNDVVCQKHYLNVVFNIYKFNYEFRK